MVTCTSAQPQKGQVHVPFYSPLKDLINELLTDLVHYHSNHTHNYCQEMSQTYSYACLSPPPYSKGQFSHYLLNILSYDTLKVTLKFGS